MQDWLASGVQAVINNNRPRARGYFARAVQEDPHCVQAWLWLARCLEDPARRGDCYQRVLALDPSNEEAQQALERLAAEALAPGAAPAAGAPPAPRSAQQNTCLGCLVLAVGAGVGALLCLAPMACLAWLLILLGGMAR